MNELYLFKKEYYGTLHFKPNEMRNSLALLMFDNWVPSLNIPYMQDCYSRLSYSESSSRSETYIGGIQSYMLIIVPFYSLKVIIKSSRRFDNSVRTRASR